MSTWNCRLSLAPRLRNDITRRLRSKPSAGGPRCSLTVRGASILIRFSHVELSQEIRHLPKGVFDSASSSHSNFSFLAQRSHSMFCYLSSKVCSPRLLHQIGTRTSLHTHEVVSLFAHRRSSSSSKPCWFNRSSFSIDRRQELAFCCSLISLGYVLSHAST